MSCASTYNSCSSCSGRCSANCGTPVDSMCSNSACYGHPSCINNAEFNATGYYGCSQSYCFSSCGSSKCSNMCYSECNGLATSRFYFTYIVICILNLWRKDNDTRE